MRPAISIRNKKIVAFNILEFKVISHDSAEHSLKSNEIISYRSFQYCSKWFVVIVYCTCYFPSIGVGMEPGEAIRNTKLLFLNLAITFFSLGKGSSCLLDRSTTLNEARP